ncbi:hypothetical protein HK102_002214 [Quaeritorhiza haematococci]|nr:hypothetical protein HK102_002214 [Quaeritorhiza haematococci]
MVSFKLLNRGVVYFTTVGANYLPLIKYGMDEYYRKQWNGLQCERTMFPLVCWDGFGSIWYINTELGAANVLMLLTTIMICIHTTLSLFYMLFSCKGKTPDFLAGAEDGCCGAAAIMLSFAALDQEVDQHRSKATWKVAVRFITASFQIVIIVASCAAINTVSGVNASPQERIALFVYLPVLMLNIISVIENFTDALRSLNIV